MSGQCMGDVCSCCSVVLRSGERWDGSWERWDDEYRDIVVYEEK